MTSMVKLKNKLSKDEIRCIYEKYYSTEYFIRLLDHHPNIKWVKNTNFCDLSTESNGNVAVITVAIDNLLKGGAAQAMQSFNLMHGFEENIGLTMFATNP
jgi:N-acetyl-gamma-glutamyl-phosphate reductase